MIERRPGEYTDFQTTGTYRDALRDARSEAKQIGGASRIIVQSCEADTLVSPYLVKT